MKYTNGNASVWLDLQDGTRIIEYPDNEPLTLKTPLNIDIRVSTQCPYGYDKNTKRSTCEFCHESALVDGQECDYGVLQQVLTDAKLPRGTEIALGVNQVTDDLIQFVKNLWKLGLIVNITMNERYITEFGDTGLLQLKPYIFGLGISYRSLQGFTDEQFETCAKIQSDAQLYKQAGNSVSIPIVYELGKNIIEHHRRLYDL